MGRFDNMSLGGIYSEIKRLKGLQSSANSKAQRLKKAYDNTGFPMDCSKGVRKDLPSITEKYGKWEGDTRSEFDDYLSMADQYMKRANNDLDDYRDAIESARAKAQRQSGLYIPILSDAYTAIKKLTN